MIDSSCGKGFVAGYENYILNNIPRLLTQLDRDKNSQTYGCFDRNYWNYKIRDFSSAILQQGVLTLALIHSNNFEGNIYYQNEKIREWAIGSIAYWMKIQLKDGSFNEYWPNEHGYPPTVFSLYSISEAYRLLEKYISDNKKNEIKQSMLKSFRFISKSGERGATNQAIAAISALYSTYLSTRDEQILKYIEDNMHLIIKKQSQEGWFPEYGGADIGYLSVSFSFLAEYYRLSKDQRVLPALTKTVDFLQYFIHPDGTVGGEYGSRNTEYFLPNGLEILAPDYPLAGVIADKLLLNMNNYEKLPCTVDDRYLSHYFLHSYVSALLNHKPRTYNTTTQIPCEMEECEKYFQEAKIYVVKNKSYFTIFSLSKRVLKIYISNQEILNDCGYVSKVKGKSATTNWIDPNCKISRDKNIFSTSGTFHLVPQHVPTPVKHMLLRGASWTFGKNLIPVLKKQLITKDTITDIKFDRKILFEHKKITIEDLVFSKHLIKDLSVSNGYSLRYVPSSKYFHSKEINRINIDCETTDIKGIRIVKEIDVVKKEIKIDYNIINR